LSEPGLYDIARMTALKRKVINPIDPDLDLKEPNNWDVIFNELENMGWGKFTRDGEEIMIEFLGVPIAFLKGYVETLFQVVFKIHQMRSGEVYVLSKEKDRTEIWRARVAENEKKARKPVVPVVAYIVAGSPPFILEKHGIPVEKAEKIRSDLANRNWGEAFGAVDSNMIDSFAVCGSPDQCIEKIETLFKTGISHFVTGSPLGPNVRASIKLFGIDVLPHFKELP
jgi:hypothetical protein